MNDELIKRLAIWAEGGDAPPYKMEIHLTNRCNLSCLSCWLRDKKAVIGTEIKPNDFLLAVKEGLDMGVVEWWLAGGGEPLLEADFALEVMRLIKSKHTFASVVTNGVCFTPFLIEQMVELQWDMVVISIDAPKEELQDKLRNKKGTFQRNLQALRQFAAMKQKLASTKPKIRINTVISNYNLDLLPDMINLAFNEKAEEVIFHSLVVYSESGAKMKIPPHRLPFLEEIISLTEERAQNLKIHTNISNFREKRIIEMANAMDEILLAEKNGYDENRSLLNSPCFDPWFRMVLLPDGRAGSCNAYIDREKPDLRGKRIIKEERDYFPGRSLAQIWQGEVLRRIRQGFLQKAILPICLRCCAGNVFENRSLKEKLMNYLDKREKGEN